MPRARKKPSHNYHHGDLAQAIREVATAIVGSDGPSALTVRSVADRLGVTHAAIYHHFSDRTAILAAVAELGFDRLGLAIDRAMSTVEGALMRYREQGMTYVRFATQNPRLYGVMFGPEAALRREYPELSAASARVLERIRVAVTACIDEGVVDVAAPDEHTVFCWATVHGLSSLIVTRQLHELELPQSTEALTELVVNRVFTGLGPRA